jgi:uncharacterized protein (TIGR03067 family)
VKDDLDNAVGRLGEEDRKVVLLRFYQQCKMAEVGTALNISEDAAKKRVAKAVENLRNLLRSGGVAIPALALAAALEAATTHAAPAAVLKACAGSIGASGSAAAAELARQTATAMVATKSKLAAIAAVILLILTPLGGALVYFAWPASQDASAGGKTEALQSMPSNFPNVTVPSSSAMLEGSWTGESVCLAIENKNRQSQRIQLTCTGNQFKVEAADQPHAEVDTFALDVTRSPAWIDLISSGHRYRGICEGSGDGLIIRLADADAARPTDFVSGPFENEGMLFLTRGKGPEAEENLRQLSASKPTYTLLRLAAAILDDDRPLVESCASFSDKADGEMAEVVHSEVLWNAGWCRVGQEWMKAFGTPARVDGFDFDVFPGLHGGYEQLLDRALNRLTPGDITIEGDSASVRLHLLARETDSFGQGAWRGASLRLWCTKGRWVLDAPATTRIGVTLQPSQTDPLRIAAQLNYEIARIFEDAAGKIHSKAFKRSSEASDWIAKAIHEASSHMGEVNMNLNTLPASGG